MRMIYISRTRILSSTKRKKRVGFAPSTRLTTCRRDFPMQLYYSLHPTLTLTETKLYCNTVASSEKLTINDGNYQAPSQTVFAGWRPLSAASIISERNRKFSIGLRDPGITP